MDALVTYENFYKQNKCEIIKIMEYFRLQKYTIALWGAGRKGQAFLNIIDKTLIDFIFDKNEKKFGTITETGHKIVDYKKVRADVIFLANSMFELEVVHSVKRIYPNAKVINLESIVLGKLQARDVINEVDLNLSKVRDSKICAVTVLYHPEETVINNILSYVEDVDTLYIWDNSEYESESIHRIKEHNKVEYLRADGNAGLCVAYNNIIKLARDKQFEWMITFDQDSFAEKNMITAMREFIESSAYDNKIAIVAPQLNDIDFNREVADSYCTYCYNVYQSGAMFRLDIIEKLGGFDENLFIYQVDNEISARCIVNGYKVVKINKALLMHNQQEVLKRKFVDGMTVTIEKYLPLAYYYFYRNSLYCYDKYKDTCPVYALDCSNWIPKFETSVKYDWNPEENKKMLVQARYDYEHGKMGKMQR